MEIKVRPPVAIVVGSRKATMQDFFEDPFAPTMVRLLRMLKGKKAITRLERGLNSREWVFESDLGPRAAYEYRERLLERGWVDVRIPDARRTSEVVTSLAAAGEEFLEYLDASKALREAAAREGARKLKEYKEQREKR